MFYSSHTEVYNLEDSLSDSCEELLCRSMVFSTVLYLVITKEAWQEDIPSRLKGENTELYVHSGSVWPWHLRIESYHRWNTSNSIPEMDVFITVFKIDNPYFCTLHALMVKADLKCIPDRQQYRLF